jgi:hypothetical protein
LTRVGFEGKSYYFSHHIISALNTVLGRASILESTPITDVSGLLCFPAPSESVPQWGLVVPTTITMDQSIYVAGVTLMYTILLDRT